MPRDMMKRWFTRRPRLTVDTAEVPAGIRVYAIGDIHGRVDLLRRLHGHIIEDSASEPPGTHNVAVYVGDYVDRGLHSRDVIDLLLDQPLPGFESIHLRGNHDHEFVAFLEDPVKSAAWLRYGGDATLYSYGVRVPSASPPEDRVMLLRDQLRDALPPRHLAFLIDLPFTYEVGDFLFVHAGIDPDKPLDWQTAADMLWIRERFLEADADFGKIVVHGHSISDSPDVRENRIGIDTGACYSNVLTSLVIEGRTKRFLSTAGS